MERVDKSERQVFYGKIVLLTIFALTMGYWEGVVVVYLRRILPEISYETSVTSFMEHLRGHQVLFIERTREVATIVMLATIGCLVEKRFLRRLAVFLWCFGVWDIFYYVTLYLWLRWPSSLMEIDCYFLIPGAWFGPVFLPVFCSVGIMGFAFYILYPRGVSLRRK